MEFKLTEFLLVKIFSYLDEYSLRNYDTALTEKEKRKIYLECLKKLRCCYLHINRWTHLKGITNFLQYVNYENTQYISNCKKLILYTKDFFHKKCQKKIIIINVINDNIENIHIDSERKLINIKSIKSKNLKILLIVNCYLYDLEFLKNIIDDCPKLKKINFIHCKNNNLNNKINEFKKNYDIDININVS